MMKTQITSTSSRKKRKGLVLAETAASLAVILPVAVLLLFVICEVSYCFMVKGMLADSARQAARGLAIDYGRDPSVATNRAMQEADVLDRIKIPNIIKDPDQFTTSFDITANGRTVHVVAVYQGGTFGLPLLPTPDPLRLGGAYQIYGDATYRLE